MAKTWTPEEAAEIVIHIYQRVLERDPDPGGIITWGERLVHGSASVRDTVRDIGKSDEYRNRFVTPFAPFQAAKLMYKHFLARDPESDQVCIDWGNTISQSGWQAAVDGFVNSEEYSNRFGEDSVPA